MPTKRVASDRTDDRQKIILTIVSLGQQAAANGDDLAARLLDGMARLLGAALSSPNS